MALSDPRPGRKKSDQQTTARDRLNAALAGRPNDRWYPDLVGVIRAYPPTSEKWIARRERLSASGKAVRAKYGQPPSRLGIPDGFAGRRAEVEEMLVTGRQEAAKVMNTLAEFEAAHPDLNLGDDPQVRLSFQTAVEIMLAGKVGEDGEVVRVYNARDRLAAANLINSYLKEKPTSKVDAKVTRAEDFLGMLVGTNFDGSPR